MAGKTNKLIHIDRTLGTLWNCFKVLEPLDLIEIYCNFLGSIKVLLGLESF